jgi:hypothetical protein
MLMKYSTIRAAVFLISMGLAFLNATAQDAGSPSPESYDKVHDPVYITGTDSSYSHVVRKNDSIASPRPLKRNVYKPSPVVPKERNKSESDDDSVLSFNFLYYLIQKYKMQDIVD